MNPPDAECQTWAPVLLAAGLLAIALEAVPAAAQKDAVPLPETIGGCALPFPARIPDELAAFVLPETRALCAADADLNGDGLRDYVLVLEKVSERAYDPGKEHGERPLLVLVREPGGALRVASRNDRVVYCAACGGVFGDPFEGVEARAGTFTVYHYGGSAWRWRADYTFRYVPAAGTWRLWKVIELSYHAPRPEKLQETIFIAPDHIREIDLADFHPERWKRPSARDR
jgi:hypothetical protein